MHCEWLYPTYHDRLIFSGRIGYSRKGWADGKIGLEWLKHFDSYTQTRAKGWTRLLLVEEYNSHHALEFLQYAISTNIEVLWHTFIKAWMLSFSLLSRNVGVRRKMFSLERLGRRWQRIPSWQSMHRHIFVHSVKQILMTFLKTGAWLFNPNVINTDMMAPSLETCTIHTTLLPQTSPLCTIRKLV